jgi:hypothetical protein
MRSRYYMVRPSVAHVIKVEDFRRIALKFYNIDDVRGHALVDEHDRYFGAFAFQRVEGVQWDIVRDSKVIEREKNNPTGLLSRLMSAYRTKAEVDKIWMLVKKGL